MKMPKLPSVKMRTKIFRPGLILFLLFVMLLAIEAYLLYYKVYENLNVSIDDIAVDVNIVRLDINNYNRMVELLDSFTAHQPTGSPYENPFR